LALKTAEYLLLHVTGKLFWSHTLSHFPGVKKMHHFRFSVDSPGVIYYRIAPDEAEQSFELLRTPGRFPSPTEIPEIEPPGLTFERQRYLFEKIREFVKAESQDVTYPRPDSLPVPAQLVARQTCEAVSETSSSGKTVETVTVIRSDRPTGDAKKMPKRKEVPYRPKRLGASQ
jgi:hypothetical protein